MSRSPSSAPLPRPEIGGLDDGLIVERASATPGGRGVAPAKSFSARSRVPVPGQELSALQAWFQQVISAPESPEDPHGLIRSSGDFAVAERLGVYHYGYQARLTDCLVDDFPGVRQAVGEDFFARISQAYIQTHPSQVRTLNLFGLGFSAFLRCSRLPRRGALADLAALEWALVEVLHAQAAPVLNQAALAKIPLERWAGARFTLADTVRILATRTPANAWLNALRHADAPVPAPAAKWSAVVVYRQGFDLWRMPLTKPMHAVLTALAAGQTLGEALSTLEKTPARDRAGVAAHVMDWFGSWVAGGCFAGVRI